MNKYFTKNQQNLQQHPNCVSILPNVKTSHFETTMDDRLLECIRSNPLFATFTESHLMLIFLFFLYKIFCQSSGRKSFTFSQVSEQDFIFKLNSKLNIFNVKKQLYEVNFCGVQGDAVMTSSRL